MVLNSGQRPRARRWSAAIYDAYPAVEGLIYPSSMHANQTAMALYERCVDALPSLPSFHRSLADPLLNRALAVIARSIDYTLSP